MYLWINSSCDFCWALLSPPSHAILWGGLPTNTYITLDIVLYSWLIPSLPVNNVIICGWMHINVYIYCHGSAWCSVPRNDGRAALAPWGMSSALLGSPEDLEEIDAPACSSPVISPPATEDETSRPTAAHRCLIACGKCVWLGIPEAKPQLVEAQAKSGGSKQSSRERALSDPPPMDWRSLVCLLDHIWRHRGHAGPSLKFSFLDCEFQGENLSQIFKRHQKYWKYHWVILVSISEFKKNPNFYF